MNEFKISDEQRTIYEHIKSGKNVIVDSIAGSGKSTTIIHIAKLIPETRFLHITYNSMLRKEFKEKIRALKIANIEVHTYHSFAVKYFVQTAHTDTGIREILTMGIGPSTDFPRFDVVVMDECQDMTALYYHFIRHAFGFFPNPHPQLLFLGDYMQCLYEFKGADWRFLTLAHKIWADENGHYPPDSFIHRSLKTSYRITNQMASFVNNVMLGEERMNACRDGCPVVYIRNSRFFIERTIIHHIQRILDEGDLPSDIFILAPSVKGAFSNVRKLENILVESGIPCHVPMFENERISDERVIDGKIVFSTFHSVKGRQRKYVFVLNFDNSYFTYNARNLSPTVCPNTLYVATTRATHKLFLLEINQKVTDRPLDFLKMSHSQMNREEYIDFKGSPQSVFYEETAESKSAKEQSGGGKIPVRHVTPTDLIKFIPENTLELITPLLKKIVVANTPVTPVTPPHEIDVPTVVLLKNGLYEDICDLNGIAIPTIYCDHILTKMGTDTATHPNILWKFIENARNQMKEGDYMFLKRLFDDLSPYCVTPGDYLYMSNVFVAFQEKLYFKLKQIGRDEYNWLTPKMVEECNRRMDEYIAHDPEDEIESFENTFLHSSNEDKHEYIDTLLTPHMNKAEKYRFTARLDVITTKHIWELKFVKELTIDHQLQFVIYAWLWRCVHYGDETAPPKDFKLFNVRTGEILRLDATMEELTEIMVLLIKGKYETAVPLTEDEFIGSLTNKSKKQCV
jgi:hypothetical protein